VIRRLVEISRPVLWVNTIGTTVIGMWLAGELWTWAIIPILIWVTFPFNLLIYGINDIYDQDTDADNDRKGGYGGAKIKPHETRMIGWGVILTNVPFLPSRSGNTRQHHCASRDDQSWTRSLTRITPSPWFSCLLPWVPILSGPQRLD